MIAIIDFGSQTTHLISRRLREFGIETTILDPENFFNKLPTLSLRGIILSGGPKSVYQKNAPTIDRKIFDLGLPVLGICYGLQLFAHLLNGKVTPGKKKEYGPATIRITHSSSLLINTAPSFNVWMSHGDEVVKPPAGFTINAVTDTIPSAAVSDEKRKMYGIQFHPEVIHTQFGEQIL